VSIRSEQKLIFVTLQSTPTMIALHLLHQIKKIHSLFCLDSMQNSNIISMYFKIIIETETPLLCLQTMILLLP